MSSGADNNYAKELLPLSPFIAHAGGSINTVAYSNSQEALDYNYEKGFRFIELDFEWTSDGKLVLLHDWATVLKMLFNEPAGRRSLEEFKNFKMKEGLRQLTLEQFIDWLKRNKDVFVITDIKTNNITALERIKGQFPIMVENFIPQVYDFEEYFLARKLGYRHIILTLYRSNYLDEEIVNFAKKNYLAAVTMPIKRGLTNLPRMLKEINVPAYVHTVNDEELLKELKENGVFGIYTDLASFLR
ncbi:MAG: amidohydrolase [Candidatus Omnitrophica bacterium]|nr:amidohydrolase [Candidatus Omnitrophota bacterium]